MGTKAAKKISSHRTKHGKFNSIFDICSIDSHVINKKSLEALILSGSLDSLGGHRSQLYSFIDYGNLFNNPVNIIEESIWDYGLGLVYKTKLGPIRIDFGFPYGNINEGQLHASLLYMF